MDIKLEIQQQEKQKKAFAQLPDLPENPFFKRVEHEEVGHVYEAKQRCWYWLWTFIGPMDGGDYLPTVVSAEKLSPSDLSPEELTQTLEVERPQTAHAWMQRNGAGWQHGGRHLHHWHGGEIAEGACIYIGGASWNPESILIPGGDIELKAGGGTEPRDDTRGGLPRRGDDWLRGGRRDCPV